MSWETILDPAFSLRVCITLAHSFWQVALFTAIAWGLDRLGRRRSVETSYALYVAALLAGLAAMPVTYAIVDVGVSGAAAETETVVASLPTGPPVALNLESGRSETGQREQASKAEVVSPGPDAVALPSLTSAGEEPSARWLKLAPWIVGLYAAGVLFMLARLITGIWHARRLAFQAELIGDGTLVERLNRLARTWSMRIVPLLAQAEGIIVPKVIGLLRPMILLPVSAITCLSIDELEMIVAHELAHVRRFDTWVNLAQRVAEVTLFFNPALWYLSRRTSALREYCCDELTCRATSGSDAELRTRYASALVRIVELARPALGPRLSTLDNPIALAAAGRSPSDLRRRVARLFGEPLPEPVRLSRGGLLTIAILAAVLLIAPIAWHPARNFAAAPTTDTGKDSAKTRPLDAAGQPLLILDVDKEGGISVHGRSVSLKEYIRLEANASFLNARRTQPNLEFGQELPTTVVIRADRATPFRVLHGVMTECLQNGFRKFELKAMNAKSPAKALSEEDLRVDFAVVVARHVLLLDGKEIITWAGLEKTIAVLPEPSRVYPHFYITRGAYEAGVEKKAKEEMWRLHQKFKLKGHSEGSLWPRADFRYDAIKTAKDLVPDESLRVKGRVVDAKGGPVAGAEVLLVTPVDKSISYKSYDIALVQGRARNPLEEIMTHSDAQGQFSLYPPKDLGFVVVALHPKAGFNLSRSSPFTTTIGDVRLLPWATLVSKLAAEAGECQEALLHTRVRDADGLPEIIFNQYWVDLKQKSPADEFRFTHVPPIFDTTISRLFPGEQGVAHSLPGATVGLMPGETRRLDLGPLSDKQREYLEWLRKESAPRIGKPSAGSSSSASPAADKPAATAESKSDPAKKKERSPSDEKAKSRGDKQSQPQKKSAIHARPQGNCSIAGKVLADATGTPVPNARMYLFYVPTSSAMFVNTDKDGTFIFKGIPMGPYSLQTSRTRGYQDVKYDPEGKSGQLPQFSLKEGEHRSGIVLKVKQACRISGRVLDDNGNTPQEAAHLVVWAWFKRDDGKGYAEVSGIVNSADATYTIDGLDGKPVYVMAMNWRAAKEGLADPPVYYPSAFSRSEAKLITFEKERSVENVNITRRKDAGLVIHGTVRDAAGKPIPEAFVVVHGRDVWAELVTAYSDQQGRYEVQGLGKGEFLMHADAAHRGFVRIRNPIDLNGAAQKTQRDFTLTQGVLISGKLVDTRGNAWEIGQSHGFARIFARRQASSTLTRLRNLLAPSDAPKELQQGVGRANRVIEPQQPHGGFSLGNFHGKHLPKDAREYSGSIFPGGEGPYAHGEMLFPTKRTFVIQGMMPGHTLLGFAPQKERQYVAEIRCDGRDIRNSGIDTKAGQEIRDVTIVIGTRGQFLSDIERGMKADEIQMNRQ